MNQKLNTPPSTRTRLSRASLTTLAAVALALQVGSHSTQATSDAWDGSTSGLWATSANWLTDPAAVPGTGDTATFNAASSFTTIDLGAGVTVSNVLFDTASAAAYTIGSGAVGSQVLTLDNLGGAAVTTGVANNQLFNASLTLSPVANARNTLSHVGSGTLTLAGGINAVPATGNSLLTVTNTGNVTISGQVTETGAGSFALLKTGTGTLTITTNGVWGGNAALYYVPATSAGGPLTVREGTLRITGGTNTATGEVVIGGVVANGAAGQNAKIQVDGGRLSVSSWFSIGRGNGFGGVSSDLELNNDASVITANLGMGFNGGNGTNLPRGSVTLNNSSFLTANGSVFVGESVGSDMTLTVNGTSSFTNLNSAGIRVSSSGKGALLINGGTVVTEGDLILNYSTSGETNGAKVILNGGILQVAGSTPTSTAERWLIFKRTGTANTDLIISNGTLRLNNQTDLRYSTSGGGGTNTVTIVNGAIIGYSDRATTVGGDVLIDMQQNSGASAAVNVFNLDGGVVQVRGVISAQTTGTRIFNFNGGTLKPNANNGNFFNLGSGTGLGRANVRNGGAVIDTDGKDVAVLAVLWHSDIAGDNATDGGLTKLGAGNLWLTNGSTFNGPITVRGGTLNLNPSGLATYDPFSGLTVSNSALALNVAGGASTISVGTATLQNNAVLNLNYGSLGGNPGTPAITSSGQLGAPGTGIVINLSGVGFTAGAAFPVIDYSGTPLANVANFSLVTPPGVVAVVTNNTANTSVDILVQQVTQLLTWYGSPNLWDINNSLSWNGGAAKYLEYGSYGDIVTFDDTATDANVTLNTAVVPALVTVNNNTLSYSVSGTGGIGGATSLTKSGVGALTLSTANSYTGGTIINGGTVTIPADSALGSAAGLVTLNGGALQASGSFTSSRPLALNTAGTIGVTSGANVQWGGVMTGASTLTKTDNGTLTLTAANNLSGNIWVKGGALTVDSGGSISNATWNSVGQAGSDVAVMTLKGTGSFIGLGDFNVADIDSTTGTLNIQDNAVLTVNSLFVSSANNVGSSANGTLNQTGGTVTQLGTGIGTFAIGGRRDPVDGSPVGVYNISGGTVIANAGIRVGGNGTGTINQSGGLILARGGINVARFTGATGTNNLNGGTLETFNVASSSGLNAFFNFNGGTLKAYTNNAAFFTGLTRANVRDNGGVIDTTNFSITIAQALMASDIPGDAGTGGLTKTGNGTLTLTGTNSYAGPTVLSAGKLIVQPTHKVTGPMAVAGGATFAVTLPTTNGAAQVGALTLGSGATTLEFNYGTNLNSATPILVAGALTNSGTCTIRITGTFAVGAIPLIDYTGSIQGGGTFVPQILAPVGVVASYSNSVANSMIYAVVTEVGAGLVWTGTNAVNPNVWDINISTNWLFGANPKVFTDGDPVSFNDVGSGIVNLSNTVSPVSLLISNNAVNYSFSGPGAISGTTGLRKLGSGTVTINLAGSSFTGPTVISNGTLTVDGGGAIGDQSAVTVANVTGVSLVVNGNETVGSLTGGGASGGNVTVEGQLNIGANNSSTAFAGTISGAGRLVVNGTGTFTPSNSVMMGNELWVGGIAAAGNTPTMNIPSGVTVTATNWLVVGRDGATGTININGGALVHEGGGNLTLGTLGTNPRGIINLNSGSISNRSGETYLGEGSSAVNFGEYNQSGGTAYLGTLRVGRGATSGMGIGTATITGGTLNVADLDVGYGNNNTRVGTNILTIGAGTTVNASGFVRLAFAGSTSLWGMLTNNGGTLNVGSTALYLGFWDPCQSYLAHNSGQINLHSNASIVFGENGNNSGSQTFDQNGGTVTFYSDAGVTVGGTGSLNLGNAGSGNYTYNLSGGTLTVPQVRKVGGGNGVFNFNGGTLKAAGSSATFMQGLTGAYVNSSGAKIDTAGYTVAIAQDLQDGGGGGLVKTGAGTLNLNGNNAYLGTTVVSNGMLGGIGTIAGSVDVTAGGALAPGASIGTLTLNGALNLAGNVLAEVNTSLAPGQTNDLCVINGGASYTGSGKSVIVSNLGPTLVVGDTFQVFSAAVANGNLLAVTGGGATWQNNLAVDGSITVLSILPTVSTTPTNLVSSFTTTNVTLSWPNSHIGWNLQAQTNSRAVGLTTNNWFTIPGSSATNSVTIPTSKTDPTVFYRLQYLTP